MDRGQFVLFIMQMQGEHRHFHKKYKQTVWLNCNKGHQSDEKTSDCKPFRIHFSECSRVGVYVGPFWHTIPDSTIKLNESTCETTSYIVSIV